jgi:hypothetical protein
LIEVNGIVEMPTAGVHISDVTGTGRRGLVGSYTDDLELHNVQLNVEAGPAFQITHSTNLELDDVSTRKPVAGVPVIRLGEVPGAVVRNSRAYPGTDVFLSTPAGELKDVGLVGNLLANAATPTAEAARVGGVPAAARTREACLVQFDLDTRHPTDVGDEAMICLNIIAADLKRSPRTSVALVGNIGMRNGTRTSEADALQRVRNSRDYLVKTVGIDAARIQVYVGEPKMDGPEDIDRIEAQMVAGTVAAGNVETILIPVGAVLKYSGLTEVK